ncbi:hypothetical protein CASFOL_036623 [Castilleja foliolosa]|uniref:Uncharacterized protein n=1 Tax=Castilleja foliolosa TaxID=1961234 RepID=A0ABD3BS67_9LAMI
MSYPQRRMTRSQCARVAAALAKAEETGESSGPRPRRNPNKADSSWISNVIDLTISKRVGDQASTGDEVESMGPGRKKALFIKNQTSAAALRMMNRVRADDPIETSRKQSNYAPDKMEVPSKAATETQAVGSRTESTANREPQKSRLAPTIGGQDPSSGRPKKKDSQTSQTVSSQAQPTNHQSTPLPDETTPASQTTGPESQSTGPEIQSTGPESQSSGRQSKSSSHQSQSTHNLSQSAGNKAPSASPQEQPDANQTQSQAPNITSFGLRDEETDSGKQTNETDQDDADETVAVSSASKRKRGPTMGRGLMKAGSDGKKIKIEVDPAIGRPKERLESAKFSSQVGVVARDVLPVVRKWKEIDVQNALDPCIDHMQIHLDVNMDKPGVRQCVIERLKNSSRQQRYRLHVHYKKFGNVREAKRNKPASVNDQQQWEILCDHFNSPEFQHQSEANSNNRKKMQAKHVTGRTPFTIIQNEISLKNGDCDMIELYKYTHANVKGKWSSALAKKNWEQMNELRELYAAEGVEKSEQEIVAEVVGRGNGYIKGLGYGPKPPGKQSQLQQELEETRVQLGESKTEVATYKNKVDAMNEQLTQQAAQIAKLMAYMEGSGSKNNDQEQQTNRNEANEVDEHEGDGQGNEQEDEQEDDEQDDDEDDDLSASQYSTEPTV